MLFRRFQKEHVMTCQWGCCTSDDRPAKLKRRSQRRIEKREWKKENR